jgi:hypothetical protein
MRAQHRREHRLHERLAGLEVLACDGGALLLRELLERGDVDRQVRRAVRERDALLQRGPGVDHRRRDRRIVRRHRRLEPIELPVHPRWLQVHLGRRAPDHHRPRAIVLAHEPADVLAELLAQLELVRAALHVRAVESLHVVGREHRGHRLHRRERLLQPLEERRLEDAGVAGGLVRVIGEDVPRAEANVVERRERHELLDERRPAFRALAEPDGAHLRERPDRLREPSTHRLDSGDEGGADGAEPGEENGELPGRGGDGAWLLHGAFLGWGFPEGLRAAASWQPLPERSA